MSNWGESDSTKPTPQVHHRDGSLFLHHKLIWKWTRHGESPIQLTWSQKGRDVTLEFHQIETLRYLKFLSSLGFVRTFRVQFSKGPESLSPTQVGPTLSRIREVSPGQEESSWSDRETDDSTVNRLLRRLETNRRTVLSPDLSVPTFLDVEGSSSGSNVGVEPVTFH